MIVVVQVVLEVASAAGPTAATVVDFDLLFFETLRASEKMSRSVLLMWSFLNS